MKNFTFKSILTALVLLFALSSYSQGRTCGMEEYMEEMLKDPVLAKEYEENQKQFRAEVARRLSTEFNARGGATIEIPVAVHFPTGSEANRACLEALAQSQIDVLNADYSATNSDLNIWNTQASVFFPGLVPGTANITFCLATSNHPAAVPQLVEGQPAVTIGYNFANGAGFPEMDFNFQGYLNFLVKPIGGILGYSPGGGSVANGMAVVINTNTFGIGSGCPGFSPSFPYNQGRTTTHELGHFFNLDHPFNADSPAGPCGTAGDGIADTPEVCCSTYGCPAPGSIPSCTPGQPALTMNYMDYADDRCMYMFTPNQMTVAESWIQAVLVPAFKPGVCAPANAGFTLTADNSPVFSCPDTDTQAVFDLTYTTILDFSESTTFTAFGQPMGSSVSFSPGSLNDDGSFTMTIGNLGATAQGEYTITVTGTSNSVTESIDVVLNNNCTAIVCTPHTPDPADLPLAVTDGTNTGNVGTPVAQTIINVPNSAIIDGMTVTVDMTHTYVQDLILQLVHPNNTDFINLWAQECTSENFNNTVITFDDSAPAYTCPGGTDTNIMSGTYAPSDALSAFDGLDAQGDWLLFVADSFAGDIGQLNSLTVTICAEEALSVDEFALDNFAIFPNPNNGEFTIKMNSNSVQDIQVDVFDIRGRKIFNNVYSNNGEFNETVNLNSVQAGMYLVTVNDGNNEVTKRIIVE